MNIRFTNFEELIKVKNKGKIKGFYMFTNVESDIIKLSITAQQKIDI